MCNIDRQSKLQSFKWSSIDNPCISLKWLLTHDLLMIYRSSNDAFIYDTSLHDFDILTPCTFHKGQIHGLHLSYTFLIPF